MASAAVSPLIIGYAVVATVLALVVSIAQRADFSVTGILAAAAPGWLAAQHVPLGFGPYSLAVLPLLPTALSALLIGKTSASAADRLDARDTAHARNIVFTMAGAHAVFGVILASLLNQSAISVTPAVAFFGCGALAAFASIAGIALRRDARIPVISRIDPLILTGLKAGVLGFTALWAAGALLLLIGLVTSWTVVNQIFAGNDHSVGDQLGLLLLSIGYLPNALIASMAFAMGPGFTMGTVSLSPLHIGIVKLPAVPFFAAIPPTSSRLLLAVGVLPLLAGLLVGWRCRTAGPTTMRRIRAVIVAAAVVGACCFLLSALAGGRFGGGEFSPITVPAGLVGAVGFGWITLPGIFVVLFFRPKPAKPAEEPGEPVSIKSQTAESVGQQENAEHGDHPAVIEDEQPSGVPGRAPANEEEPDGELIDFDMEIESIEHLIAELPTEPGETAHTGEAIEDVRDADSPPSADR